MQKKFESLFYYFSPGLPEFRRVAEKREKKKKKLGKISWNFETFQISDSIPVKNNKKNEQPVSNSAPYSTSPVKKKKKILEINLFNKAIRKKMQDYGIIKIEGATSGR